MVRKFVRPVRLHASRTRIVLFLITAIPTLIALIWQSLQPYPFELRRELGSNVYAPPGSLYNAWKEKNESCSEWIDTQVQSNAYLDAYVVGSQKAGTTQISYMLDKLGVRRNNMIKEWHFFNHLTKEGSVRFGRFEFEPIPPLSNLTTLRALHYSLGFPAFTNFSSHPPIDNAPLETRTVVIDSTVEYLHMERAAYLASVLSPHARIVIMIRDPPSRALSQYNMLVRITNQRMRKNGQPDSPSSAEEFNAKVQAEIDVLRECGYDDSAATLSGNTTMLIKCMRTHNPRIDDVMYVLRGLYFLHIFAWRRYFADHRLLFVPFSDITHGYEHAYQRINRFLCVKPFSETLMKSVHTDGSDLSFGERAVRDGLSELGDDTYIGNDRYLSHMWPSTRKLLDEFYTPANKKLSELLGRPMFAS